MVKVVCACVIVRLDVHECASAPVCVLRWCDHTDGRHVNHKGKRSIPSATAHVRIYMFACLLVCVCALVVMYAIIHDTANIVSIAAFSPDTPTTL